MSITPTARDVETTITVTRDDGRETRVCVAGGEGRDASCSFELPAGTYSLQYRSGGHVKGGVLVVDDEGIGHFSAGLPDAPPPRPLAPTSEEPSRAASSAGGLAGVSLDFIVPHGSEFARLIRLWGYQFGVLEQVSLTGAFRRQDGLLLGGRLGVMFGNGGDGSFDGNHLGLNAYDLGGLIGVITESKGRGPKVSVSLHAELGASMLLLGLGTASDASLSVRAAVIGQLGFTFGEGLGRVTLRGGYQYLPHGTTGISTLDPAFSGLVLGLGLELTP